jgi:hypothetical protein
MFLVLFRQQLTFSVAYSFKIFWCLFDTFFLYGSKHEVISVRISEKAAKIFFSQIDFMFLEVEWSIFSGKFYFQ